ncbi:hypothetical protein FISHEDRAFT_41134, partial [Fistulina hepatica ATCC 64428]
LQGFEWIVRDLHRLKDSIERSESIEPVDDDEFEILKQSFVLGDNKFKIEFEPVEERPQTLSLFITSLLHDYSHPDYELAASIMVAIKSVDKNLGGTRPDWVFEHWSNDWVFRQENEVFSCILPPISSLLEHPRIREADSFIIDVQVHCPIGVYPRHPSAYYVSRDLLAGLEASLDNANTGDVRFVCLERQFSDVPASPVSDATGRRSVLSSSSSHSPLTARKRVIYAHSDILICRSEYFATMLRSSFSENSGVPTGERKLYTIVVEEADFVTIYWLLKFCYTNWLRLKDNDDPRAAVNNVGSGWSVKWRASRGGEWDWKIYRSGSDENLDSKSAASVEDVQAGPDSLTVPPKGKSVNSPSAASATAMRSTARAASTSKTSNVTPSPPAASASRPSMTSQRRTDAIVSAQATLPLELGGPSAITHIKAVPLPTTAPAGYAGASHYPVSPRSRQHVLSTPDPHPHPTSEPQPASALSIYQIAHRYAMPGLAALAQEHILATITPQTCFAMLLATSPWDELHSFIQEYVVEKWDEVSVCDQFENCCQEVAAGEWGVDGGKTLASLFRRLRSPHTQ